MTKKQMQRLRKVRKAWRGLILIHRNAKDSFSVRLKRMKNPIYCKR